IRKTSVGKKLKLPWIEVKKHEAQGRAQLVPLVISTAGRHEGQLPRKAPEPRSRLAHHSGKTGIAMRQSRSFMMPVLSEKGLVSRDVRRDRLPLTYVGHARETGTIHLDRSSVFKLYKKSQTDH